MAKLVSYFNDFLADIRLTESQIKDCIAGHTTLRDRLQSDETLAPIIVNTFLQGSYRRSTAVRPCEKDKLMDVDVIVVTSLNRTVSPKEALGKFEPFLEKYYKGKYEPQGRSWGIKLSYVELDLVPTSAPSEAKKGFFKSASVTDTRTLEEIFDSEKILKASEGFARAAKKEDWQLEPLWIPDRDTNVWEETDPLTQIQVTQEKNKRCNGNFVNVVKCLKWWRSVNAKEPKYPKSYPLEHLIWGNCPDGIDSVAEGLSATLEGIKTKYSTQLTTPFLCDHGVYTHNVLARLTGEDWRAFIKIIGEAADLAKKAFKEEDSEKSAVLWAELLGDKFPLPKGAKSGGYTPRSEKSEIDTKGRFA